MKKQYMALAGAAALLLPVLAHAQSNVNITGRAWMALENVRATGATAGPAFDKPSINRVTSFPSYLRFSAEEDLGDGTRAWFQLENDVVMDTGPARLPDEIPAWA